MLSRVCVCDVFNNVLLAASLIGIRTQLLIAVVSLPPHIATVLYGPGGFS